MLLVQAMGQPGVNLPKRSQDGVAAPVGRNLGCLRKDVELHCNSRVRSHGVCSDFSDPGTPSAAYPHDDRLNRCWMLSGLLSLATKTGGAHDEDAFTALTHEDPASSALLLIRRFVQFLMV